MITTTSRFSVQDLLRPFRSPDLPVHAPPSQPASRSAPCAGRLLERTTGPLEALGGLAVTVVADFENLICSAEDLGYRLCPGSLAERLRAAAGDIQLNAFYSQGLGGPGLPAALVNGGWSSHVGPTHYPVSARRTARSSNSDNNLLATTGYLLCATKPDAVVIASGDGELGAELARSIRMLDRNCRLVATMSLPGSTARRLDARLNQHIDLNIEIGEDCMVR